MKTLKATSKCLRCEGIGHWTGDPECKFSGKSQGGIKASAHMAVYSSSSSEEGLIIDAEPSKRSSYHAYPARGRGAAADDRGCASDDPPNPLQGPLQGVPMDGAVVGGDRKFYL